MAYNKSVNGRYLFMVTKAGKTQKEVVIKIQWPKVDCQNPNIIHHGAKEPSSEMSLRILPLLN